MGVLFGYYAAADDEDAARAVVREDDEPSGTGYDELVVKGIDPVVGLVPAEVLVTGLSAEAVKADPRHGQLIAMVGDGDVVSVALTDVFRDRLAAFDRELLTYVARGWAASGQFYDPPDAEDIEDMGEFLRDLAELAGRAVARGHRLYCWMCA
ncbi:hypothetical protein [Yinghuangia seranimata]|uniref:hypothetical protein n=1 Tax=Yinghuangia seranimata TaxID=408067 RepID=UPI00248B2C1F|nr:hypothetical protein [Yinghuangia seranimata]MDI2131144.1 hypothetical protein [Yinghuangia seranimata]